LPEGPFERAAETLRAAGDRRAAGSLETAIEGSSHPGETLVSAGRLHAAVASVIEHPFRIGACADEQARRLRKGGRNPLHEVVEDLSAQVRRHIGDTTHEDEPISGALPSTAASP